MASKITHHPTTPTPPEAWLVIRDYDFSKARPDVSISRYVLAALPGRDDPELQAIFDKEMAENPGPIAIERDHPSLAVSHYGMTIQNPCWLTCRDIWFQRHASVLVPHLRDPRKSQVFTFAPGKLFDPLISHQSSATGPFAFPRGMEWPSCGFCQLRLSFLCALDFRNYRDLPVPGSTLVCHVCQECGIPSDTDAWKLTWLKEGEPIEILGDRSQQILVGTPWSATEYPLPAFHPNELTDHGAFLDEDSIYFNFSCFADKIGGHVYRIQGQGNEEPPTDSRGNPMTYICQFIGSPDIEIWDCGVAYIYYSPQTEETVLEIESF